MKTSYTITGAYDKNSRLIHLELSEVDKKELQRLEPKQIGSKERVAGSFEIVAEDFASAQLVWNILVEKWGSRLPIQESHLLPHPANGEQDPYSKSLDDYYAAKN